MSAPHVLAEVKDGIGWLTLNRPESLNALSFEMTDLLIKHTAAFEKDPAVRCVVVRGAGDEACWEHEFVVVASGGW